MYGSFHQSKAIINFFNMVLMQTGGSSGTDAEILRPTMATSLRTKLWDNRKQGNGTVMTSCSADPL